MADSNVGDGLDGERGLGDAPGGETLDDAAAQQVVDAVDSPNFPPPRSAEEILEEVGRSLPEPPPDAKVNLNVPYIHQLWDTPDAFDGDWACGPTSVAMVLAYYGLLEPKETTINQPFPHTSPYGGYIPNSFSAHGRTFDADSRTPDGKARGLYGAIVNEQGLATYGETIRGVQKGVMVVLRHFMTPVGNTVGFIREPTRKDVIASLEDGHPVILSGNVFGWGHLLVIKGYHYDEAANSYHWIVNDPYGYQTDRSYDGGNVAYRWDELHKGLSKSKYLYRIHGSFKPA